jgi:ribosomal protein S18 acetylase RimI-like enzyme
MNGTDLSSGRVDLSLRWMLQRDLSHVLRIAATAAHGSWTRQEFVTAFQSSDTAGWVAEAGNHVAGFVIYAVNGPPEEAVRVGPRWGRRKTSQAPLRIVLLNLAVAADWRRRGVGRALLGRLGQKIRQAQDCIQATVPESNLAAQLLLRNAGYKATRVLRRHFGDEDGYLMERQHRPTLLEKSLTPG